MKLSVVYSFYNEEKNLNELIGRTRKTLRNSIGLSDGEYEMVFVNDRSRDKSLEILKERAKEFNDLKIVTTSRKFGNAQCILAGFSFAQGDYIAYLDSDLQDPPELIENMYNIAHKNNVDIVHTKRTKRLGENAIKLFITNIGYAILASTMSEPIQRNVGDFKVISRRVAQTVLNMYEPLPFIRGMISYAGFPEYTLEYERQSRGGGESHFPVIGKRVISNFINNALIGYSDFPLHLIIYTSVLEFVAAIVIAAYIIYNKVAGLAYPGSTSVILCVIGFSSLIQFSLGIVGLYLASMKKAILRRPNFIVDSVVDFTKK
jgi:dolichol-phosphate mannosyltransferase